MSDEDLRKKADLDLAEKLVDEALAGLVLPPSLVPTIRATLMAELLVTTQGRRLLRHVAPDPEVTRSDEVERPGANDVGSKATGSDPVSLTKSKAKPR